MATTFKFSAQINLLISTMSELDDVCDDIHDFCDVNDFDHDVIYRDQNNGGSEQIAIIKLSANGINSWGQSTSYVSKLDTLINGLPDLTKINGFGTQYRLTQAVTE